MRTVIVAVGLTASAGAWAQAPGAYQPPRLADGHPDFQGVWINPPRGSPLEKGSFGDALVVSADEARAIGSSYTEQVHGRPVFTTQADLPDVYELAVVRGEHRTRLLVEPVDGKLPYTPAAQKAVDDWYVRYGRSRSSEGVLADNPEERDISERCLTTEGQPPMRVANVGGLRQIVQSPGYVVIHSEYLSEVRIVRIDGAIQTDAIRTLLGDSIGHWEGDVLVVETRAFRIDNPFHVVIGERPVMVGRDSVLVERFRRVSGDELDYTFTIQDPAIYARPWLGEYALTRSSGRIYEVACHEGNQSVANILQGARRADAIRALSKTHPYIEKSGAKAGKAGQ